jgi:hypothetical protein
VLRIARSAAALAIAAVARLGHVIAVNDGELGEPSRRPKRRVAFSFTSIEAMPPRAARGEIHGQRSTNRNQG